MPSFDHWFDKGTSKFDNISIILKNCLTQFNLFRMPTCCSTRLPCRNFLDFKSSQNFPITYQSMKQWQWFQRLRKPRTDPSPTGLICQLALAAATLLLLRINPFKFHQRILRLINHSNKLTLTKKVSWIQLVLREAEIPWGDFCSSFFFFSFFSSSSFSLPID